MMKKIKIFFIYVIIFGCGFHLLKEEYNNVITTKTLAICFLPFIIFFIINIIKQVFKKKYSFKRYSFIFFVHFFSINNFIFFISKNLLFLWENSEDRTCRNTVSNLSNNRNIQTRAWILFKQTFSCWTFSFFFTR